jgi:hypothetical protein
MFSSMASHRTRIVRIVAALLTLTLSAQVVGAQVASCALMGHAEPGNHAAMTEHQHAAPDAAPAAGSHDTQRHETRGNMPCSQSVLCANAAAIPSGITRSVAAGHAVPPIFPAPAALAARALAPDSPPPRI